MAFAAPLVVGALKTLAITTFLGQLFKKKPRGIGTQDSKPPTLSERGSGVQILVGRDRLAPVFVHEWDQEIRLEDAPGGGGKGLGTGGGGQKNQVQFGKAQHIITLTSERLMGIRFDGETVFPRTDQPALAAGITPQSHPSGSAFTIEDTQEGKNRGTGYIYWGEEDQPTHDTLQQSLATTMNFGGFCYVVWEDLRQGGVGRFPTIEYDIEARPFNPLRLHNNGAPPAYDTLTTQLSGSDAWLQNGLAPDEDECQQIINFLGGREVRIAYTTPALGFPPDPFTAGTRVALRENATDAVNQNYTIESVSYDAAANVLLPDTVTGYTRRIMDLLPSPASVIPPETVNTNTTGGPPDIPLVTTSFGTQQFLNRYYTYDKGSLVFSEISFLPVTTSPTPPGGPSGFTYGNVFNDVTIYYKPPTALLSTQDVRFVLTDNLGGNVNGLELNVSSGTVTVNSVGTVFGFTETVLGSGWRKYNFQVSSTDAGIAASTFLNFRVQNLASSSVTAVDFLIGNGLNSADALVQYATEITSTEALTLTLDTEVSGTNGSGEICPLVVDETADQGANPAHIIYQLLFAPAPFGLEHDQACYDIGSLQDLGVRFDAADLGFRRHVLVTPGSTIQQTLDRVMKECFVQRVWDVVQGVWSFKLIEEETAIAQVTADLIAPDEPEIGRPQQSRTSGNINYQFARESIGFRDDFVPVRENDNPTAGIRTERLETIRDAEAASQAADVLSLLDQGRPAAKTVRLLRDGGRLVRVGDVLDFQELLGAAGAHRVVGVQLDHQLPQAVIQILTSPFALPLAETAQLQGRGGLTNQLVPSTDQIAAASPQPDVFDKVLEISGFLSDRILFQVLRIPADDCSPFSTVITSQDGSNFTAEDTAAVLPHGQLALEWAELAQEDESATNALINQWHIENGPVIRELNGSFLNNTLTLSNADWHEGRQWLVVNNEIMYVREFEALGGGVYQAKGVTRARLDTDRATHAEGDYCWVVTEATLAPFFVPYASRQLDHFQKVLPKKGNTTLAAASASSITVNPTGDALRPMSLEDLRTDDFSNAYLTSADLDMKWSFRRQDGQRERTGYGMQAYGEPTGTSSEDWEGTFTVTLTDSPATTVISGPHVVTDPNYSFPAADLVGQTGNLLVTVIATDAAGETGERLSQEILPA